MGVRQQTFDDLQKDETARIFVQNLTPKQIDIISFLERGYYQAYVADRLKISRAYVNQTVNSLLKHSLIKQKTFSPLQKKSLTYELTQKLKTYMAQTQMPSPFTLCIPHYIKFKYPILNLQNTLSREGWKFSKSRTIFIRSWKPKGLERSLFHVNSGENTIGIEVQDGVKKRSLVAYRIEHTQVMAQTIEEATQVIAQEIGKGVEIFLREQGSMNCRMDLGQPTLITKPDYAFESEIANELMRSGQQSILNGTGIYVDNSPEKNGDLGTGHFETKNLSLANKVDKGLRNAAMMDTIVSREIQTALPAAILEFNKALNPLTDTLMNVEAMMQGSITTAQKEESVVKFMTKALEEMAGIRTELAESRKENAELKSELMRIRGAGASA